jgi:hypothetical protein
MAIQCKRGRGSQKILWFGRLDICEKMGQRIFGFHYDTIVCWKLGHKVYNITTKPNQNLLSPSLPTSILILTLQNEYTLRLTLLSLILTYSKKGNTVMLRKWES